jgi:hypothetical protein
MIETGMIRSLALVLGGLAVVMIMEAPGPNSPRPDHEELLTWRDSGQLPDADPRILERELDDQESILPGCGPEH